MVEASSRIWKSWALHAGVIPHEGDVLLLLRVAEAPKGVPQNEVAAAVYNASSGRVEIKRWSIHAHDIDLSDPRSIDTEGKTWLTSISHLRIARSRDGIHFEVEAAPALAATNAYESFASKIPRITLLDDTYWINDTASPAMGSQPLCASTKDFKSFDRHGLIFSPPNRDVTIFRRNWRKYGALHRPMPEGLGKPAIGIAKPPVFLVGGPSDTFRRA